jgi:hypothetical protein
MEHLEANLKALEIPLTPEQIAALDTASKPVLNFPAEPNATLSPNFEHAGATVNGVQSKLGSNVPTNEVDRYRKDFRTPKNLANQVHAVLLDQPSDYRGEPLPSRTIAFVQHNPPKQTTMKLVSAAFIVTVHKNDLGPRYRRARTALG